MIHNRHTRVTFVLSQILLKALEAQMRIWENGHSHTFLRKQIKKLLKETISISHSTLGLESRPDAHAGGRGDYPP